MPKKDISQLAKFIVDQATGEIPLPLIRDKDARAVVSGRLGGLKGGKARAEALTSEQKKKIAATAAAARWNKN